ncbi:DUF5683 domain-containing protein [Flavobacterium selenitireducens]|uniref:DUF5683 domain-containing protein n=1 Tax=Flavobacterium selenitireducens TaxID=2722704 RepID=UPI00168AC41B|nr:DUF5683 domain-containing protein [Flavobacterium selenitireducens]MBD3582479.1 hypothetical protein [Flavobacterium selenitireducens]
MRAFIALLVFSALSAFGQKVQKVEALAQADTTVTNKVIDPLRPAKAAFYSAIVPGLGQVYNKRYWKVPLVYGAIGTSLYFYSDQNTKYKKVRDAYKRRLAGYYDDEYQYLDDQRLISAQRGYKKNREYSLLFAVGFYVLNIVDANIDAHLKQFNVSNDLTLEPDLIQQDMYSKPTIGLTLNYRF